MSPQHTDIFLLWVFRLCALCAAAIVFLIIAFLVMESLPALLEIGALRFVADASWHPLSDLYNMLPMIVASLLITGGAIALAAPFGIASAIFCHYYAPPFLRIAYRRLIEILAGIPSVVYGFWGLVVLVPLLNSSTLTGIIIVSLMILPTVALIAGSSLAAVPLEYIRGSAALGFTRWATIQRVILPVAGRGLLTAVILASARAIGETMAVLMVCGNVVRMPDSLMAPVRTLTANIALEMSYAADVHRSALFVSGLFLMALVVLLIALVDRMKRVSAQVTQE